MSAIDLIILGQLLRGPKNAYEMKKMFDLTELNKWVKISIPALYKNLVKLHDRGYLDAKIVKKGEMPEKTIYYINQKGSDYFLTLMKHYSSEINYIYFDFAAFVFNLPLLEKKAGTEMLHDLNQKFKAVAANIESVIERHQNQVSYISLSIIELYQNIYNLFYQWSHDLMKKYDEN
jgi:DNA-binding PadR family transcriptional regulator